jgi:hypothetical protein
LVTVAALVAVSTLIATAAHVQWAVTNLTPAGSTSSGANAISSGQQATIAA